EVTGSFTPFYNTSANPISTTATASTPVQTDCSYGYKPWVVGVAAGIPSFLALILAVILTVVCVLQWSNFRWKQTSECREEREEHEYEQSPPRPPNDIYLNVIEETRNVYVNEDQGKHFGKAMKTQAKPPRVKKPTSQLPVTESIYENHPSLTERKVPNDGWNQK
ncbi:UNVERIFIED_CONTAM: hypothetical protein H355_003503, partial [Colinus virginianus]